MWRRSVGVLAAATLVAALASTGCFEQESQGWWAQMKYQPAVQAFESTGIPGHPQGFSPPPGTVPVTGSDPITDAFSPAANALKNPVPADLRSIENGKVQFDTFCSPCHGLTGHAEGPVAKVFVGVLPLVGVVRSFSDGHIFERIRLGGTRMPSYQRIPAKDRWDIVNYVRFLDAYGGQS